MRSATVRINDVLEIDSGDVSKAVNGDAFISLDSFTKTGSGDLELSGALDLSADGQGLVDQGGLVLDGGSITLDNLLVSDGAPKRRLPPWQTLPTPAH